MLKNIIILLLLVVTINSYTEAREGNKKVTKDLLNYYTYCYNSGKCTVPNRYYDLIELNVQLIIKGEEPLWK
jgi:hypothetical protein